MKDDLTNMDFTQFIKYLSDKYSSSVDKLINLSENEDDIGLQQEGLNEDGILNVKLARNRASFSSNGRE